MPLGLFGKLPAKRDFVAVDAPRRFLDVFEPWLQASVAASKQTIGNDWQAAFLHAPIWRFWLGAAHCGLPLAGAFMPSVDAVGRYFPLVAFAFAEDMAPPEIDAQADWFAGVEALLLSALDSETAYTHLTEALAAYPAPAPTSVPLESLGARRIGRAVLVEDFGKALPNVLAALRRAEHRRSFAGASFWWTVGGGDFVPAALVAEGLPEHTLFAAMLTGAFPAPVAA
jgi:type VI secretion system protein ImpM